MIVLQVNRIFWNIILEFIRKRSEWLNLPVVQEERDEEEAREELFKEALVKEIEGQVGERRELEDADKEKELV